MVRENSIVVTGAHDDKADYDYANGCELRVYAIHDGVKLDTVVYGMDNAVELSVSVKRLGHCIHVTADGSKNYSIRMINMHASNAVNGFLTIDGNDSVITPDAGAEMIEITF
jgi:alpha-D-xyloside xylohydrolase